MPECPDCHIAAIAVAHSASAVRDLGVAGAFSIAAASALGIGYKRRRFDGPGRPLRRQRAHRASRRRGRRRAGVKAVIANVA